MDPSAGGIDRSFEHVHVRLLSCCLRFLEVIPNSWPVAFCLKCACQARGARSGAACALPGHSPLRVTHCAVMGMIVYTQHNKNFSHIFLDDGTHTGDASQAVQLRCCIEDSEAYSVAVRDELGERSNEWLDSELNRTRFDLRVGMVVQMLGRLRRKKATLVSDEWVLQVVVSHAQLMAGAVGAEDRMRIEYMQLWDEVYRPGNSWLHTVPDSFWIYLFKEISDSARASEISRLCTEYGDEVVRSRNLDALVRPTVHELTKGALHALEEQHDVRSHSYTELVKQKAEFFLSYSPE